MDRCQLKLIAVVSMLVDHIGAVLLPQYIALRYIGRIAFPIYCFLLVEGYYHTRDVKKYLLRLSCFALLSEIPYDLAFRRMPFYWNKQNVFFTLSIGLAVIALSDWLTDKSDRKEMVRIWQAIVLMAGCLLVSYIKSDYTYIGVILILFFYLLHESRWQTVFALGILMGMEYFSGSIQWFAVTAAVPILLYNGGKGRSMKYAFYLFYPVHLLVLYGIGRWMR